MESMVYDKGNVCIVGRTDISRWIDPLVDSEAAGSAGLATCVPCSVLINGYESGAVSGVPMTGPQRSPNGNGGEL